MSPINGDERKGENFQNGGNLRNTVSWQDAEDTLMAAFEYLGAMPDRERAYLAAGTRTAWPAIVREAFGDYADVEADPSPQLTRRCANLVERMLIGEKPLADAIPEGHRALVGRVLTMKRWPGPEGFGWDRVYRLMGGKLFNLARREELATTSDGMRKAYERAIHRLVLALDKAA
jgi:hypothetical protein